MTREQGLTIQKEQLAKWRVVLNDKAYKLLKEETFKQNFASRSDKGEDVWRGSDMDAFVHNIVNRGLMR